MIYYPQIAVSARTEEHLRDKMNWKKTNIAAALMIAIIIRSMAANAAVIEPLAPSATLPTFRQVSEQLEKERQQEEMAGRSTLSSPPKCPENYADPVRMQVGGTEFRIPDRYKSIIHIEYDKGQAAPQMNCACRNVKNPESNAYEIQLGYCQEKTGKAFEGNEIFIPKLYTKTDNNLIIQKLDMQISGALTTPPQEFFCANKQKADKFVKEWVPYKNSPDFYVGEDSRYLDSPRGSIYYYSYTHLLWGMPVLIECERAETVIQKSLGRMCSFQTYIGTKNSLVVRFYDKALPPSEWGSSFKDIEMFLQGIMIAPPAIPPFSSCPPPSH